MKQILRHQGSKLTIWKNKVIFSQHERLEFRLNLWVHYSKVGKAQNVTAIKINVKGFT